MFLSKLFFAAWLLITPTLLSAATRPNVVILFTDDQGTLDANCFGSKDLHTPNIDRLAETGVRFTQAYAHTVCCPARAALMTGRHPQRSTINTWAQRSPKVNDGTNMNLEEVTIAEAFKASGYKTALFGKWHLGAHVDRGPKKQGFDEFFGLRDGFIDNYRHFHLHREGFHDLFEGTKEIWFDGKYFPELMVDRSLTFLEENQKQPFLLYVGFNIPHYPEECLQRHSKMYADLPEPRRTYARIVTTTDYYIGQVVSKIEELGLRDDTIILFLSDNGHSEEQYAIKTDNHSSGFPKGHNYGANGGGGNTGKWIGHKGTFLEGGIRTPAILSNPKRLPSGAERGQIVTAMDWYPTLLKLCDVKKPDVEFDGRSILPVIRSNRAGSPHSVLHFQWQDRWAVRKGNWKLIQHGKPGRERFTLHNLSDTEPEVADHIRDKPEVVAGLKQLHSAWSDDVFNRTARRGSN